MGKLTQARLKEVVHYDPETGKFTRLESSKQARAGQEPGTVHKHGYRVIGIDGEKYRASHLAWLYVTGEWPVDMIDHIDRNRGHDAFCNLRQVTNAENCRNRSAVTGKFVGTAFNKESQRWTSQIRSQGHNYHLGYFNCETAAHLAYLKAKPKYHAINTYQKEA